MLKTVLPLITVLLAVLQGSNGQKFKFGRCPKIEPKHDFDLNTYLGTWYHYASWGTQAYTGTGKCVKSEYKYNSASGLIDYYLTQSPASRPAPAELKGSIRFQDPSKPDAKLYMTVKMPMVGKVTIPYFVLGTDYVSWSVTYTCFDFYMFHLRTSWILTRDKTPSSNLEEEMNAVLKKINLSVDRFKKQIQTDCKYV